MTPDPVANSAYDAALRFLTHRPRSRTEVRQRLQRRGFSEDIIEATLRRLEIESYLDDDAFARYWTENRQQFSPRSRWLITQELRRKGVEGEVIADALQGFDEEAEAVSAATNKARSLRQYEGEVLLEKLASFLRRRGFSFAVAQRAAQRALEGHQEH